MKITKVDYDKLTESQKSHAKPVDGEDGFYDFNLDGYSKDAEDAISKKALAESHRREKENEVKQLKDKLKDAEDAAKKKGVNKEEADAIEKAYKEKIESLEGELKTQKEAQEAATVSAHHNEQVSKLANELFVAPEQFKSLLEGRLKTELVDGEPITRVLGEDGKVTADSVTDLKQNFLGNEAYKGVLKAESASGGGADFSAGGKSSPSGASSKSKGEQTASILELSGDDLLADIKADVEG